MLSRNIASFDNKNISNIFTAKATPRSSTPNIFPSELSLTKSNSASLLLQDQNSQDYPSTRFTQRTTPPISKSSLESQKSILDCSALLEHENELEELLCKPELLLSEQQVQQVKIGFQFLLINLANKQIPQYLFFFLIKKMAVKVFSKQLRSKQEILFANKLLRSTPFFEEEDLDIVSSDIFTRDLAKNFKIQQYEKHHQLFEIGSHGDRFYIVLSGSVYCLIPNGEKQEKNENTSQGGSIIQVIAPQEKVKQPTSMKMKEQIQEIVSKEEHHNKDTTNSTLDPPQNQLQRRKSVEHSAMNQIVNSHIAHFKNNDENESQFLGKEYPHLKLAKIMRPGEAFGEIALLSRESKRTATVVFRESSWVLSLDKTQFDHIMGNYKRYALDDNVIFLKTFQFFQDIPSSILFGLLHQMNYMKLDRKSVVFAEKDPSGYIFFLKNGNVEISRLQNSFEENKNENNNNKQSAGRSISLNQQPQNESGSFSGSIKSRKTTFSAVSTKKLWRKLSSASCERITQLEDDSLNQTPEKKMSDEKPEWELKEKSKSQKRVVIASLGEGSYFGEEEAHIKLNPIRLSRAVCQSSKTEILSIEKEKLFEMLKEQGKFNLFLSDATQRHTMRQKRVNRLLESEKEARDWAVGRKYLEENFVNLQESKFINSPSSNMSQYFSAAIEQNSSICSPNTRLFSQKKQFFANSAIAGNELKSPQNISTNNINATNSENNTFAQLQGRSNSMPFVLEDVERSEDFQRVWSKKKRLADIKSSSKLFTMNKDHYVVLVNKILKEGNFSKKLGSLPSLEEKFSFQHIDHSRKSGKLNKYDISCNENIIPRSTSYEKKERNITPQPKKSQSNLNCIIQGSQPQQLRKQPFQIQTISPCNIQQIANLPGSRKDLSPQSATNKHNFSTISRVSLTTSQNSLKSKQRINSSLVFNSLVNSKQKKLEYNSNMKQQQPKNSIILQANKQLSVNQHCENQTQTISIKSHADAPSSQFQSLNLFNKFRSIIYQSEKVAFPQSQKSNVH